MITLDIIPESVKNTKGVERRGRGEEKGRRGDELNNFDLSIV